MNSYFNAGKKISLTSAGITLLKGGVYRATLQNYQHKHLYCILTNDSFHKNAIHIAFVNLDVKVI